VASDCPVCQRSNGYSATVDSNGNLKSATVRGQFAESQSRRQKAHRTVNSDCPVHHRTIWWPRLSELQRSNPNGWMTWLAHRTVWCAHRQQPSPTAVLVVGAIVIPSLQRREVGVYSFLVSFFLVSFGWYAFGVGNFWGSIHQ
jgi:hypothetical protein